jgi:hypothetical protein
VSKFWKKDRFVEAARVRPARRKEGEKLPVAYNVHGFGGSHEGAWYMGAGLQQE